MSFRRQSMLHVACWLAVAWSFALGGGFLAPGCKPAWAAAPRDAASVRALVEKTTVSVGEPLLLQIRVEGSDIAPGTEPPDLSAMRDFTVEELGGQSSNSSSITIINGQVNKVESFGYVYSYRLTAGKVGTFTIPAVTVPLDPSKSKVLRTDPITIRVTEPEVSADFHLELKLSKTRFYVGEPVLLSVTWYIGKDIENVAFNIPLLQDDNFNVFDPRRDHDPRRQVFQIEAGSSKIVAEKGTGVFNGRQYTTLSFSKVLFARKPGTLQVPEATVSCRALVGYARPQQRRTPFDPFFDDDFFSLGRKGVYKTFVSRSQPVTLTVLPLPEEGRPPGFTGWVGRFQVDASASPTEVGIGDPITLEITVRGPEVLDHVELPSLSRAVELGRDFKVPEEMASGVLQGNAKRFTQTLRPTNADVKAIPPLAFSTFDPETGRYEVVSTKAIPLVVKPTRVLTSADVEGRQDGSGLHKSELESWSEGIAHNYEGPEVLERRVHRISSVVRTPLWLAVTLLPFGSFVALAIVTTARRRRLADPQGMRARKALARFQATVRALEKSGRTGNAPCAELLDAVRGYFGDKLRANGAAMTLADIEARLESSGIDAPLWERLKRLFETCERGAYAGSALSRPFPELVREAAEIIASLDRAIKGRS